MNHNHAQLRRESDQIRCLKCGKVWDAGEDPPPCESVRRQEYLRFIRRVFKDYMKGASK
jgi:hypothetical protein